MLAIPQRIAGRMQKFSRMLPDPGRQEIIDMMMREAFQKSPLIDMQQAALDIDLHSIRKQSTDLL